MKKNIRYGKLIILSMTFIILITSFISAQQTHQKFSVLELQTKGQQQIIDIPKSDNNEIILTVSIQDIMGEYQITKGGEFPILSIDEWGFTDEIGEPKLPVIRESIKIPYGADYTLKIIDFEVKEYSLKDLGIKDPIMPVQEPIEKTSVGFNKTTFKINKKTYKEEKYLLNTIAKINSEGVVRGERIILLEIFPIDYNPNKGTIKVYENIKLKISLKHPDIRLTNKKVERYSSEEFDRVKEKTILNYEKQDEEKSKSKEGYLIITDPAFKYNSKLSEFIDWKNNQGLEVTLVDTNQAGLSKEQIRNYVKNAYDNWNIPPSYVLLIGDTNSIPNWVGQGMDNPATDLNYATVDGNDYFPDVGLGRFSVSSTQELENIIYKTMNNQLNKKGVFMASEDNYDITEATHDHVISNFFNPEGWSSQKLYHNDGATTSQVSSAINNGRLLAVYSGHGGVKSWADGPPFSQSDIRALTNSVYPVVLSFACVTGSYHVDECFGETWIRDDKGASVFVGSSVNSWWGHDDVLERKMFYKWFNDNQITISEMLNYGKYELFLHYGDSSSIRRYYEMYNILGDPQIQISQNTLMKNLRVYNDGDSDLSVTSITGPSWAMINPTSFSISGHSSKEITIIIDGSSLTPGTHISEISIYSNDYDQSPLTIPITVKKTGNNPPEINPQIPSLVTNEDTQINLDLTSYGNDIEDSNEDLIWSVSDVNTELFTASINSITDLLTINPVAGVSGSDEIILTLTDSGGETDSQSTPVTIIASPDYEPPVISLISPKSILTDPHIILEYTVSDKSEIANCSLLINGIMNQTDNTITKDVPQYFPVILSNGNYDWSIKCIDDSPNNNVKISEAIDFEVIISPANILLIDDDEGYNYESYYQNALSTNNHAYHNWDLNIFGSPSTSNIDDYHIIIWFTSLSYDAGWMEGTLNENETESLESYLDNGGNLFLSTQDYLYDYYGGGVTETNPGDFAYNYLYVSGMAQDVKIENITGVPGDEITNNFTTINLTFPFTDYPDIIEIRESADAIFTGSGPTALKINNDYFDVVFLAFPFEAISLEEDRNLLMDKIIEWFLLEGPNVTCHNNNDCGELTINKYCDGENSCETINNYTCENPGEIDSYCTSSVSGGCSPCAHACSEGECINCDESSDCGGGGFIGEIYCMDDDIYQDYQTFLCLFSGTMNSTCNNSSTPQLTEDCGEDYCEEFGENYCKNGNVYHNKTCYDKGCFEEGCISNSYNDEELIEECDYECENGTCFYFEDKDNDDDGFCELGYIIDNSTIQCPRENGLYGTDCNDNDINILPPYNKMVINSSTTLCNGKYEVPYGIIIEKNNILFDCNNSELIGNFSQYSYSYFLIYSGIFINSANNVTIKNCIIKNYTNGIALIETLNSNINSNSIENDNYPGASGISLAGSDLNRIQNNIINQSYYGINVYESSNGNLFSNNIFYKNDVVGLQFDIIMNGDSSRLIKNNVVFNNSFIENHLGIELNDYWSKNNITANNITKNYFENQGWLSIIASGYINNIWDNDIHDKDLFASASSDNNYCLNSIGNNYFNGATGPICEIICTPNLQNTTPSNWQNISCLPSKLMNQSRFLVQYDANNCGQIQNETIYEYRALLECGTPDNDSINLIINSPSLDLFDNRRILLDLKATEEVDEIVYTYLDSRGREREVRLCRDCEDYSRQRSFSEGWNNLTFKAIVNDESVDEENVSFFIDSKSPRISKTEPRRNSFTNGSGFYIKVREDNLKNITITFNPTIALDLNKCTESRGYQECYFDLNLSSYNDQEINYYFSVEDIAGSKDESKPTLIKVDTNPPNLTNPDSFWTRGEGRYSNYIYFDMSIDEKNFDEAVLTYDYRGRTREKRLCSRLRDGKCEYRFRLNDAYSNYKLIILDEAGNTDSREISF